MRTSLGLEIARKFVKKNTLDSQLKYVGVSVEDLLDIFILFIRSVTEYCAVAFHSSLTKEQSDKLEGIQKTCLKVILGEMYVSYTAALEMCNLQTLYERRQKRCLDFAIKSVKHPRNKRLFPLNPVSNDHFLRERQPFEVNFARTDAYKDLTIPYCQRLLSDYAMSK